YDEDVEGNALCTERAQPLLDPPRQITFRPPRETLGRQRLEERVRDRGGTADRGDLVGVLDRAELLHDTVCGQELDARRDEPPVRGIARVRRLEGDPATCESLREVSERVARRDD